MIVVWVTGRAGILGEGVHVSWSVTAGRGSVTPLDTVTLSGGVARALWTLGPDVSANTLLVSSNGASATVKAEAAAPLTAMSIAPGVQHTCALVTGGAVYCWGDNSIEQLGRGIAKDDTLSKIPERVPTSFVFSALVSKANHTCGLSLAGEAICWGMSYESGPTRIAGPRFVALTTGVSHTCGLAVDGSAYCWGSNERAQLGSGTRKTEVPTKVAAAPPFVSVSAGGWYSCGLTADGRVFCWGSNDTGALGAAASDSCFLEQVDDNGNLIEPLVIPCSYSAIQANLNSRVIQIAAGPSRICALTIERAVVCWGGFAPEPYTVVGATGLTGIALHDQLACGLDADGTAWCWDFPGGPPWYSKPESLPGGIHFATLFGGWKGLCGTSVGESRAFCWGWNEHGQLGDGTTSTNYRAVPMPVVSPAIP